MNAPFPEFEELKTLLDALCEETITPDQVKRLEELVLQRPEAEAYYVQYMSLYADLGRHFAVLPRRAEAPTATAAGEARAAATLSRRTRLLLWTGAALSAIAAAVLLFVNWRPAPGPRLPAPLPVPEATDNTVAVLVHTQGAEWEGAAPPRTGAPLAPGWLRLKAGLAQLEFYNGAIVILRGPAELNLLSRTEAFCARGKLRATVPEQAQGFTISSPKLNLIDRGTEFAIDVGAGDKTEVHVFQGRVELHDAGDNVAKPRELITGQSVRYEAAGRFQAIKSNAEAFPTARELAALSEAALKERHERWRRASALRRKDPACLAYFTFEAPDLLSRTLVDEAWPPRSPRDGAVVGAAWTPGRWAGKHALEFKRVSDRVRFSVPGEFHSLTLSAWVRIDSLPNRNNSLMMADGWDVGQIHWQIGDTGTLILGVQSSPKGKGAHYHAPDFFTPDHFGQWKHLAVVYDGPNGTVTHYVDGKSVAQDTILFDIPLRIGDAELGNWNIASHRNNTPVRFLNGRMDEFLMLSRVLSDQEIEDLYAEGRPPS
jgi:hypothetical protein